VKRLLASALFFALVLFTPWWVWFFTGFVLAFLFKNYIEFPIFVLFSDLAFGTNFQSFFNIPYLLSIISLVVYFILEFIKPNIRISHLDRI
jgi:hypothetical protein